MHAGHHRPPILEMRSVRAGYGSIEALHGIDLKLGQGEVVALLGPNGAGKTTTIAVASGLVRPTSGALVVAGHDVTGVSASALARAGVCTIPEGRGVFPNLTVRENLLMATHEGHSLAAIEERTYSRFPRLSERRDQLAGTMSGGEQQMLALARGLATDPVVLMLDELSMGLAPKIVGQLYEQVAGIAAEGVSVLVVEQFARTVLGVADRAIVMAHGTIRHEGPADELDDHLLATTYLGGS
jgi:branched-chain amino acid transport system ATP-binding protein